MTSGEVPADAEAFLSELLRRLQASTLRRLEQITPETLTWLLHPGSHTIGAIIWHLSRRVDLFGAVVLPVGRRSEQHWIRDGWASATGRGGANDRDDERDLADFTALELASIPQMDAAELATYHRSAMGTLADRVRAETPVTLERPLAVAGLQLTRYRHILRFALTGSHAIGEIDALLSLEGRARDTESDRTGSGA